ncbi:MAG: NUDIX hydrolase, partial [Candidatus Dormibacteraceae bacterium]
VREVLEELGFQVEATETVGERIHPATKRHMVYVACQVTGGEPQLVDHEELAEFAWCTNQQVAERIPNGIFEPVQRYLDLALVNA